MIKPRTILLADTETVGLPPKNYVYDLGYVITNKRGDVLQSRNFLIREIMTNPNLMMRAFYAKKVFSFYIPALDLSTMRLTPWADVRAIMADDVRRYNVDVVAAYNLRFDMGAIRATNKLLNAGKILPRPVDLLCIWQFACQTFLNSTGYHLAAEKFGWISEAGNVRTTAEKAYAYITGENDFIEGHTALSDALIENEILSHCFRQKKKIPYNDLHPMPWQLAQDVQ